MVSFCYIQVHVFVDEKVDNIVIKTITHIGINGFLLIMDANERCLESQFCMDEKLCHDMWNCKVVKEGEESRLCVQIRELCEWRDKCDDSFLSRYECQIIIDYLYTF